jgi:hypothetical protein
MKDRIEIKSGQILVRELFVYRETNRKSNCVADKFTGTSSVSSRDSKCVPVLTP